MYVAAMQKVISCFMGIFLPFLLFAVNPPKASLGFLPKESKEFLPKYKFISSFTADSRAHRLSFARNSDQNSYTASMGGSFALLNHRLGQIPLQWSASGSTWLTLQRTKGSGGVVNNDFFADIWVDAALTSHWYLRFGTGHSSQHLSDDAILLGLPFSNYAKDYHFVGAIFKKKKLQAYSLAYFNYNFKTQGDISRKWLFQAGFEHAPLRIKDNVFGYYALDIKCREELRFEPTVNMQIGCKVIDEEGAAFRIALDQTIGKEERGSFMYQTRNFARLALYFDF